VSVFRKINYGNLEAARNQVARAVQIYIMTRYQKVVDLEVIIAELDRIHS
jgi:hypothetical protein